MKRKGAPISNAEFLKLCQDGGIEAYAVERICRHLTEVWPDRTPEEIREFAVAHVKANPTSISEV